jgi:hypothetical protein
VVEENGLGEGKAEAAPEYYHLVINYEGAAKSNLTNFSKPKIQA